MSLNLQFDFLVDKEKNTITVRKELAANRQLVWDCHTKSEYLDQWFSPKPLTTKTKVMDFRPGGYWLYVMIDPGGAEYWGRTDYITIQPIEWYTALDAFSDENGSINPDLPRSNWLVTFEDLGAHSLVQTVVTYASPEALEAVVKMGLKEGMLSTLEKLDEYLATLNK
ncbi:SRPBCC domain-containing protein [Paraflavitalea soli]|uniref:SRPBCC domain-containing protein n=1 Tax=Paraflavitalea soli TaxID=2315862 RepID=A0A3B7MH50_9BACT|nr:SRPBCC domain-containing protein [Paraflavitalea soli]AXY72469.1 SRPBCC domain-containing protein [Paraflavitalea soli]